MVNKCSIFGCNSNYGNQPYVKLVSFPTDEVERNRWIDAVPNERSSLLKLKKIFACERHFDFEWVSAKGAGKKTKPTTIHLSWCTKVLLKAGHLSIQKFYFFSRISSPKRTPSKSDFLKTILLLLLIMIFTYLKLIKKGVVLSSFLVTTCQFIVWIFTS